MELQALYDKFISKGCNRFYIDGVGGPQSDDVECFGENNGQWEIYYIERGQKSKPLFSCTDKTEAIAYYYKHVLSLEHRHLIAFTRSNEIMASKKRALESFGIRTIQNDIPHYRTIGDRIFRLFVNNQDIFKATEILNTVPYFDDDLKN
jgi:hypothetical protein